MAAKSSGDETGYLTGSNSFELSDLSGNNLHYQLVLQTSADDRDEITVTDTLPENVGFKVDNVKIALDEGDFVKIKDKNVDWATATYDETTRQLTIKIRNYNQSGQEEHRIRIQYEVSVSDDPTWKNPSVGKLIYTNTATWGELTQTTTTTVTRKVEQVKKTGWQKLSNVEHQIETAKGEVTKPFAQEQELAEKLERLAELNALLNMDEKGDNVLDMGDDEPEDETGEQGAQAQEGEQDRAEDIQAVADEPLKPVASFLMSERIAEHDKERMLADGSRGRVSVKEKLAEMKQKISDQKMPEKPKTKSQEASL